MPSDRAFVELAVICFCSSLRSFLVKGTPLSPSGVVTEPYVFVAFEPFDDIVDCMWIEWLYLKGGYAERSSWPHICTSQCRQIRQAWKATLPNPQRAELTPEQWRIVWRQIPSSAVYLFCSRRCFWTFVADRFGR